MERKFKHFDLRLVQPAFESKVTDLIIELDYLRKKLLGGSTPAYIFFQIKHIFHMLESIGSARIEGNRTTILEYIETKIDEREEHPETVKEIANMEKTLEFIDQNINDYPINRTFLSQLHKLIVNGLEKEGSKNPGDYRKNNVMIKGAKHTPPESCLVNDYMNELITFINNENAPKYDLLKTALAHHRFVWIHPFDNGNGKAVRLLTYSMLVKQGFNVYLGRIINPTAVFCHDRQKYYKSLERADRGNDVSLLAWCEYVLDGLKREIEKVDNLCDYNYLKINILIPTINFALERKLITDIESRILKLTVDKQEIMNSDVQTIFPKRNPSDISRILRNLKNKKMIVAKEEKGRKYILRFDNNYLLRGIINALGENGFLPIND